MRKKMIALVLTLIMVFGLSLTVAARSGVFDLFPGDSIEINCDGKRLKMQRIDQNQVVVNCKGNPAQPTPTDTPQPEPSPPPPTGGRIEPYAGAPVCDASLHNDRAWHGLWNYEQGCHYTHEHKDNPHDVDDIFGTAIYTLAGGEVSYPWQTFAVTPGTAGQYPELLDATMTENTLKHQGYGWAVRRNMPCRTPDWGGDGCITDLRVQYHALMGASGATTRYHSYLLEARACLPDNPAACGIIRTGGWLDTGYLMVKLADGDIIPDLPDNPANLVIPLEPKKEHFGGSTLNQSQYAVWYGNNLDTAVQSMVSLATENAWQGIDPNNPGHVALTCPGFDCQHNGSTMQLHRFGFFGRPAMDPDADGFVDYQGFTDRYGNLVSNCSGVGLDCIPLLIQHLPLANAETTEFLYEDDLQGIWMREYDMSPNGEWWIEYPN